MKDKELIKSLLVRIMSIAVEHNTDTEDCEKEPVFFVRYAGHCNVIDVDIHENGWVKDEVASYNLMLYMNTETNEYIIEKLKECVAKMEEVLLNWEKHKDKNSEE